MFTLSSISVSVSDRGERKWKSNDTSVKDSEWARTLPILRVHHAPILGADLGHAHGGSIR